MQPTNQELSTTAEKIIQLVPIVRREVDRKVIDKLRESGAAFAFHHLLIMKLLEESGDMYITEIGDAMGIAKAQMTQSIDKLVQLGLVRRQPSNIDRRKIQITLTKQGKDTVEKIDDAIKQTLQDSLKHLSIAEIQKLSSGLQAVIEVFYEK